MLPETSGAEDEADQTSLLTEDSQLRLPKLLDEGTSSTIVKAPVCKSSGKLVLLMKNTQNLDVLVLTMLAMRTDYIRRKSERQIRIQYLQAQQLNINLLKCSFARI